MNKIKEMICLSVRQKGKIKLGKGWKTNESFYHNFERWVSEGGLVIN